MISPSSGLSSPILASEQKHFSQIYNTKENASGWKLREDINANSRMQVCGVVRIRAKGGRGWYALRARQSSEKHFATYPSSSVWFIEPLSLYTNRGTTMTMAEQKPWSKIFPPAILSTVIKFDRVHRSMMHCARRAKFFGRELDSEWTKHFIFGRMESELLRYIEIQFWNWNCLQSFGIVSCVRVKFSEKWRFKRLHVA